MSGASIGIPLNVGGIIPREANDYNDLVSTYPVATHAGQYGYCLQETGVRWRTEDGYRPAGLYYCNGFSWDFPPSPVNASNEELVAGTNNTKFLTAFNLANWPRIQALETANESVNGDITVIENIIGNLQLSRIIFIENTEDLGTNIVSNRYVLNPHTTYYILGDVNLAGKGLLGGEGTAIVSSSPEHGTLRSTGLSAATALLTSSFAAPLQNIEIVHAFAVQLNAGANLNQNLDWYGVNIRGTVSITNYVNCIFMACLFEDQITFAGPNFATIGITNSVFNPPSVSNSNIVVTGTISRRFRVSLSALSCNAGQTNITFSGMAIVPVESVILLYNHFGGGNTVYSNISANDSRANYKENQNTNGTFQNSSSQAGIYWVNNSLPTATPVVGAYVKIAGNSTAGVLERFVDLGNGTIRYDGIINRAFRITGTASFLAPISSRRFSMRIALNGTTIIASEAHNTSRGTADLQQTVCSAIVYLKNGDLIDLRAAAQESLLSLTAQTYNISIG